MTCHTDTDTDAHRAVYDHVSTLPGGRRAVLGDPRYRQRITAVVDTVSALALVIHRHGVPTTAWQRILTDLMPLVVPDPRPAVARINHATDPTLPPATAPDARDEDMIVLAFEVAAMREAEQQRTHPPGSHSAYRQQGAVTALMAVEEVARRLARHDPDAGVGVLDLDAHVAMARRVLTGGGPRRQRRVHDALGLPLDVVHRLARQAQR